MDSSEAGLDGIEAQRTVYVSHDRKGICFHMNLLCKSARSLICSRGFCQCIQDGATQTGDTEPMTDLTDLYNIPTETVEMKPEMLCAMRAGSMEFLEKMKSSETSMACFKNDKGDSILHIAAAFGHHELVNSIVLKCPSLLLKRNSNDQIPLHVAALAGQSVVVNNLIRWITSISNRLAEENRERLNPYVLKDTNGNTPLHLALIAPYSLYHPSRNPHIEKRPSFHCRSDYTRSFRDAYKHMSETASCLVKADQSASFLENKDGVSPLYLAVEARKVILVRTMLNDHGNNVQANTSEPALNLLQLEGRKSLVQAALKSHNIDILDIILMKYPSLAHKRDEEGRTCLSVAASEGFNEGLCMLLDTTLLSIFECDDDGSFPIHRAVEKGHENVFKELLKRFPDSVEQVNTKGQNIFHIAAKTGTARSFLLRHIKRADAEKYLMEQDKEGNTPVHLATINWRPKTLYKFMKLYSTKTKVLNKRNADDLTPLDLAENRLHSDYVFRERMTMMVLLGLYEVRNLIWIPTCGLTLKSKLDKKVGGGKYKDLIQVLLVVTTLVATVTFAAGFTIPGGFNSSDPKAGSKSADPKAGMAILENDHNLIKFLLFDAIAMYSSIVAIVALIWAQLGDQKLADRAFNVALPSLFIALTYLSAAFYFGVHATIKDNFFLRHTLLGIFAMSTSVTTLLLTPYVIPQTFGVNIVKLITDSYLYILMKLFVNEDNEMPPDVNEQEGKEAQQPNQAQLNTTKFSLSKVHRSPQVSRL